MTILQPARQVSWLLCLSSLFPFVLGHAAIWHPSMYGFNVTDTTFPYDNRPVAPLYNMPFKQWWFHNHLDYPPHPSDTYQLEPGRPATLEIACNKQSTSYYASSGFGNHQGGDSPCPGSPPKQYHALNISDTKGCALAIAYKSDVRDIAPEDFAVFSINHTCVWHRFTEFQVPAKMPPCPLGGCHCAFFWIHSPDAGNEQMYMNGFKCTVANPVSVAQIAKPRVARRCGADPQNGKPHADPANCTNGAKQPLYWLQKERNNMFEGYYSPPYYNDLYNFKDGAQNDIFEDSNPANTKDNLVPRDGMTFGPVIGTEADAPEAQGRQQNTTPTAVSEFTNADVSPDPVIGVLLGLVIVAVVGLW